MFLTMVWRGDEGWLRAASGTSSEQRLTAPLRAARTEAAEGTKARGPTQQPPAEQQARTALQRGDREEALELLMQAYGDALYRYCLRMMGDVDAAEDAHQMTFVQAYEGFRRFAGRSSLRVWLYGIARHRCLDLLKTTRRRRRRFLPEDPLPEAADRTPHAEDRVVERGLAEELRACLAELPARIREAVALRYQEGLSYPQMAELTGERPPTLQARVARAMPVLRRCLEGRGVSL